MILTDFAMEGDNTKITTSYKELDKTVDAGSMICVSLEQSTSDFARMEVMEVQDVSISHFRLCIVTNRIASVGYWSQGDSQRGRKDRREGDHETAWS